MNDTARRAALLAETLRSDLGPDAVCTDDAEREFCSADLYAPGVTCALVVRPADLAREWRARLWLLRRLDSR